MGIAMNIIDMESWMVVNGCEVRIWEWKGVGCAVRMNMRVVFV